MMTDSVGASRGTRGLYVDSKASWLVVALSFVLLSVYSYHVQTYWVMRGSDGKEYHDTAEQIAAGQIIRTEAPYAYRIALPWLIAKTYPDRIAHGFRVYNVASAAVGTALLHGWLLFFGIGPGVAALTTTLYIASWIGPARFSYFYPEYVDPPFIAFLIGGVLLMHGLRRAFSWTRTVVLSLVCLAGAFVRETMLLVPLAFLFANVAHGEPEGRRPSIPAAALLLPLAFTIAGILLVRQIPMMPRRVLPALDNAIMLVRQKPLFTLLLSFFLTFGPIVAVVVYDWRAVRDFAQRHFYLGVLFAGVFAAAWFGGHETERYLIWGAPVAYLLIAIALQNHGATLLRSAVVFVALAGAQALAEHVFFGIPDYSLSVTDWTYLTTFGEKAWGVLNRLFVIDDFAWNLFSYFGSRSFHLVLLGIYGAFSAFLIGYLWWAERPRMIGTGS